MKTSSTFKSITTFTVLAAALSASALAQAGPGLGGGMGPGMQSEATGTGPQGQVGRGMRGMRFDQSNTRGWALMTPEERLANQTKMRAVKTYDECKLVQTEQHQAMEVRAKEKGVSLPTPRQNGCDRMKARGLIK
jgi:hypothetical protein